MKKLILSNSVQLIFWSGRSFKEELLEKEISYYKEHGMPFDVLRDGEVYLVEGESKKFLRI